MIGVGGALGAIARYGVAQAFAVDGKFPYATLAVNVVGCFMIGALFVIIDDRGMLSASAWLFLMIGFFWAISLLFQIFRSTRCRCGKIISLV
jgi:CrcB protein